MLTTQVPIHHLTRPSPPPLPLIPPLTLILTLPLILNLPLILTLPLLLTLPLIMLTAQYRMHAAISRWSSDEFYAGPADIGRYRGIGRYREV